MKKKNYLNNRDILKEIHKSKMTYCYVLDKCFDDYDYIVFNESEINDDILNLALQNRIKRINDNIIHDYAENNNITIGKAKKYITENNLFDDNITIDSVVIRVMTKEHIPFKNDDSDNDDKIRTNFAPFKHYIVLENGELVEVARSHWAGDLDDGEFCITHGKLTNNLGEMFLKLVERCSRKSNFRNYTYLDEMMGEARVQLVRNALLFNESILYRTDLNVKQLNPFAYYTSFVNNAFRSVLNTEKTNRNIRDYLLESYGLNASYTRQVENEMQMVEEKINNEIIQ